MYEFFEQGWTAYLRGEDVDSCPYRDGTTEAVDWKEGYRLSEIEDIGEQE